MAVVRHKAAIHSGHFMISDFEPDEPDEEVVQVPPEEGSNITNLIVPDDPEESTSDEIITESTSNRFEDSNRQRVESNLIAPTVFVRNASTNNRRAKKPSGSNRIRVSFAESRDKEISLATLFKSMSNTYRLRLTSPRWNRFRGLKLRWKDKIRLNNVIWRCWHMQFMKNEMRPLCAFANPLEIDNHNKIEGTIPLEGKYWKRKLTTIQKEYRHWRQLYKDEGEEHHEYPLHVESFAMDWDKIGTADRSGSKDDADLHHLLNDESMIVDMLLNTIQESSNNSELTALLSGSNSSGMSLAVPFPNPRDYYRTTTNADLLQPGLGPLQPNIIEDFELDMFYNQTMPTNNTIMSNAEAENDLISVMVTATTSNMPSGGQISWPNNPNNFQNNMYSNTHSRFATYQQQLQHDHLNSANAVTNNSVPSPATTQLIAQQSPALITQPRVILQSTYDHAPHSTPLTSPMVLSPATPSATPMHGTPPGTPLVMPVDATQQSQSALISQPPSSTQVTTNGGDNIAGSYLNNGNGNGGGGKQRTNLMARTAASQNLPPYPKGHYCYSSTTKNSLKANNDSHKAIMRSPKHRLLQHQQLNTPYYTDSEKSSSELVQLLKPKTENLNYHTDQRDILSVEKSASALQNHSTNSVYSNNPATVSGIPPPLATDFAQANASSGNRGISEHRRSLHINCEQNRRTSIKHGFEELRSLIPSLRNSPTSSHKISKAALLHKGGDYLVQMKSAMKKMEEESSLLKMTIEKCEIEVSGLQGSLPDSRSYISGSQTTVPQATICGKLRQKRSEEDARKLLRMFDEHVSSGTQINWKYWAFSRLMKPLFDSYVESVSNSVSFQEVERASSHWSEDKCQLVQIRQYAMNALKHISVQTRILEDPQSLPAEVIAIAQQPILENNARNTSNGH